MKPESLNIEDYNYNLPIEQIAEFPLSKRDESKLLVFKEGRIKDELFKNITNLIPELSLVILNNTRVVNARLLFSKPSGGVIEIFCLEPVETDIKDALSTKKTVRWKCLIGGASKWKKGQVLKMEITIDKQAVTLFASYIKHENDYFLIEFLWSFAELSFSEILHKAGLIPLPPYIKRKPVNEDAITYQTIFSKEEGSVAAPTAALHFTDEIFSELSRKNIYKDFITLHVGAGTFKPVKTAAIEEHIMHSEPFSVSTSTLEKLLEASTVISVGTTSLRTIESIYWLGIKLINKLIADQWVLDQWEAYELSEKFPGIKYTESLKAIIEWMAHHEMDIINCRTSLMIVPGYSFKIINGLITNFHQPKSTLLLLISAFTGPDWKKIYTHALENNYRFLSYGDSSLLWRNA
ncbi:MAG TPA: S-adenosylmethionine:tRNA ribosyltransferase-isomerase [Flavisolibacter sp.]|nr:S-adenosylmethionine:tRNA ribosyltransferase-isomerase [Flavisolibacter sp.]